MRILRLNKQDTAGIEERQAAERPPPLSGEAGPERAGDRDRLGFVRPCSAGPYIPFVWIQNKRSVLRLTMAEKLKIISLGGLNEIGKNMTVYEYGGDIIVIDVGMGFPDDDMYGIDVVIPDFSYLIKNKDRIRGIFLTHGHEDHIGSIPYLLRDINVPIYATRMTAGLVKLKLEEHRLLNKTKLITCEAGEVVRAGKFTVEFIHVNHSIADACGFAIKCGVGTVVHTGDFKIDPTPIQGGMMDLGRLGQLGKEGVLALLADSTNVERPGFTKSERSVGDSFDALFRGCQQRIIVTTFASNVDRIQQIIDVAARYGRKVAVTGRSMENAMKDAGMAAEDIDYVNAHGTSTHHNDLFETKAIKLALGDHARDVHINSTKSMIGHLLGAAGGVEFIVCVKSIEDGFVHATAGLEVADEECDLDYTKGEGISTDVNYAISNSLGFGGHNASLLVKRFEE